MYKVITHNIREEHFGHPMTAEAGMMIHSNVNPTVGNRSSMIT